MIIDYLMRVLFDTTDTQPPKRPPNLGRELKQEKRAISPVVEKEKSPSVSLPTTQGGKYDADVDALVHKWGILETGLCIQEQLHDLLLICPRSRPRADAYKGLVGYLDKEYGVTLTIKSRKRK